MKRFVLVVVAFMVMMAGGAAHGAEVPRLINFQSALLDDGGSLVSDGLCDLKFQVTNTAGTVLYEEYQQVEVVHGAVSAMVGNGVDVDGAPTGGIPREIFSAEGGLYLDVIADGQPSQGSMEIVSVPYAFFAQEALTVARGSVVGESIAAGTITTDHLADETLQELSASIMAENDIVDWSVIQSASGASNVGIEPGLSFTQSADVQGVFQDLDASRSQRTAVVDDHLAQLETADTAEAQQRQQADSAEAQTRAAADTALQNQMADRVSRAGDTMNGDLTVCADLNVGQGGGCSGSLRVNGDDVMDHIQDVEQGVSDAISMFAGLRIRAWGTVDEQGTLLDGEYVSVGPVVMAGASYTINFTQPLASATYIVLLSCRNVGSGQCGTMIEDKTTVSFVVRTAKDNAGFVAQPFDFVVLARP